MKNRFSWVRLSVVAIIAAFGLLPAAFAVDPPPDGGYGNENTAEGEDALFSLTTAHENTAVGFNALYATTTGSFNTGIGNLALAGNTTGLANTAVGDDALSANVTGSYNDAFGSGALRDNTSGSFNTGLGNQALLTSNGGDNVAVGYLAMAFATGSHNVAVGLQALESTDGDQNTAVGYQALSSAQDSKNVALGGLAGLNLVNGTQNVYIANRGQNTESGAIRIGTARRQTSAFIAGVQDVPLSDGVPVVINSAGQLGVTASSARYKEAIKPMATASEAIFALRPVTFRYRADLGSQATPQFGLVAEEVEKVAPELVVHDAEGKPFTVRYDKVNAMLLNEFLKAHRKVEELEETVRKLETSMERLAARIEANAPATQVAEIP